MEPGPIIPTSMVRSFPVVRINDQGAAARRALESFPWHGARTIPLTLHINECPPRISILFQSPAEDDRTKQWQCSEKDIREPFADAELVLVEKKHCHWREEHDSLGARQCCQQSHHTGRSPLAFARTEQAKRGQEEERRFGVNGGEEERGWEESNAPECSASDRIAEIYRDQLVK